MIQLVLFTITKEAINHSNESELMLANTLVFIRMWGRGNWKAEALGPFHSVYSRGMNHSSYSRLVIGVQPIYLAQSGFHLNSRDIIHPFLLVYLPGVCHSHFTWIVLEFSCHLSSSHIGPNSNMNMCLEVERHDSSPQAFVWWPWEVKHTAP